MLWSNGDILFLLKIDLIPFNQFGIPFILSHVISKDFVLSVLRYLGGFYRSSLKETRSVEVLFEV